MVTEFPNALHLILHAQQSPRLSQWMDYYWSISVNKIHTLSRFPYLGPSALLLLEKENTLDSAIMSPWAPLAHHSFSAFPCVLWAHLCWGILARPFMVSSPWDLFDVLLVISLEFKDAHILKPELPIFVIFDPFFKNKWKLDPCSEHPLQPPEHSQTHGCNLLRLHVWLAISTFPFSIVDTCTCTTRQTDAMLCVSQNFSMNGVIYASLMFHPASFLRTIQGDVHRPSQHPCFSTSYSIVWLQDTLPIPSQGTRTRDSAVHTGTQNCWFVQCEPSAVTETVHTPAATFPAPCSQQHVVWADFHVFSQTYKCEIKSHWYFIFNFPDYWWTCTSSHVFIRVWVRSCELLARSFFLSPPSPPLYYWVSSFLFVYFLINLIEFFLTYFRE